jgi:hypothetical protein
MAYAPESTLFAPAGDGSILGQFTEKDHGRTFEFSTAKSTPFAGYDVLVWIGDGTYRFGRVLKTVAYIVIDEGLDGEPVCEKWEIKSHTLYEAPSA